MKIKLTIIMALIFGLFIATLGMAEEKATGPEIGRRIIISGCLHRGTSLDTFVLLGVTERPADPSDPIIPVPIAIYWLDSTKGLGPLVGKMVEVTGEVTSEEPNLGLMTISINPDITLSTDVQLESGKRSITSKKFDYSERPMSTSGTQSEIIVKRPVYNLEVDDVNALYTDTNETTCQFEEKIVVLATELAEPKVEEKIKIIAAETKDEEKIIILAFEDIHFDFDKSTLKPEAQTILKRNIKVLTENPKSHVRLAGYTSASGTEEYNQGLSERRAKAVEDFLIKEGLVQSKRLSTIGYGETNPADYEASPQILKSKAAKANMRVLFEIVVE